VLVESQPSAPGDLAISWSRPSNTLSIALVTTPAWE
jgi:hypothetical protein